MAIHPGTARFGISTRNCQHPLSQQGAGKMSHHLRQFEQAAGRLCCFDTAAHMETGDDKSKSSAHNHSQAKLARVTQRRTESSTPAPVHKLRNDQLCNTPTTAQDVLNAEFIFGRNIKDLQGKTVWKEPEQVVAAHINTPPLVMKWHRDVTLHAAFPSS